MAWADPVVSNVTAFQRLGTKFLEIGYDLSENAAVVSLSVSSDGGATWGVSATTLSGDVGLSVAGGNGKRILWDAGTDWGGFSSQLKFRVSASRDAIVKIPTGTYQRGNVIGDSDIDEAPVQSVAVSEFYLEANLVTKARWDEVRSWGLSNGYTDLAFGDGKASNHPVQTVSWYDVVKWANAASEKAGLVPCYKVGGVVYRLGNEDSVVCDWNADGYRLPTELEWEVGARGGAVGKRFPWGDTTTHSRANYVSDATYTYDVSPTRGYHPTYAQGSWPYTNPVGGFGANGYGLSDMGGNVFQWCWDWYGTYSATADTRGGATGSFRILRGGSWANSADYVRSARRGFNTPSFPDFTYGFRLARGFLAFSTSVAVSGDAREVAVSNVRFSQVSGTGLVNVDYNLTGYAASVVLEASSDGGTSWTVPVNTVSGGVGSGGVMGGPDRRIVWNAGLDWPGQGSPNLKVRVRVSGDVRIPAGRYQRGDNLDGLWHSVVQSVGVSEFYIQANLVTKSLWDDVRTWAFTNGYTDLSTGLIKASNHPVHTVNWYDVVKWANAASEKAGLTPCYKVGGAVYRTGNSNAVVCDWNANGYRLPTELEWEVAARGGLVGKRFPWGDTITHSQANYWSSSIFSYDTSPTRGFNPYFAIGAEPYTSPVGSFDANGYGLYDMAGNVSQWCWDWYGWPYSTADDTRGFGSGSWRVLRGGSWFDDGPGYARCAQRTAGFVPGFANHAVGFRLARGSGLGLSSGPGLVDTQAPVLMVPYAVMVSASGSSGATVTYTDAVATDNVGTPTITYSKASGTIFPVGTTTVIVTATDGAGNSATGTFTVTVSDTQAPVLTVPANVTASATSASGAMVSYPAASATDNVSASPVITYSPASGTVFPLGTTTVTVTATDAAGNSATGTFTVTVSDTQAPVLTLPVNVTASATSASGAMVGYPAASATDNVSASPVLTYSQASGSVFPLGVTNVTVTATDGAGNSATGMFTVTVSDSQAPVLTVPANVTASATSASGAMVSYPAASATDNVSASPVLTYSQASGSVFPLGTTTVTVIATDATGNSATGTFTVTVSDTQAPILTVPANVTVSATSASGAMVSYPAAAATDNVSASPVITYSQASGSVFPLGTTTVSVSATDGAGNSATEMFTVTVSDTQSPVLTVPADVTASATSASGAMVSYPAAAATDNVSASPVITYSPASGTVFPLGTTTVTATATDAAGNSATGTFTVTVSDTTAPILTLPANVTASATSASGAVVSYPAASATDNVSASPVITYSQASGTVFPLGVTNVTVTATDGAGNSATGTFTVTVSDTQAPVITVPANVTASATGANGAVVSYGVATATDNISANPLITYGKSSGTVFPLGVTTVMVTATDGAGNASTVTFTVTVVDDSFPVLTVPGDVTVVATSLTGANVTFPLATATDNVTANPGITYSHPSGSVFQVGSTAVTVTVTDNAGNRATGTFTVTVVADTTAPVLSVPPSLIVGATSAAGAVVDYPVTATDNSLAEPVITSSKPSGSVFPIGRTPVTVTATDGSGNAVTRTFTVTVLPWNAGTVQFTEAQIERIKPVDGNLEVQVAVSRIQGTAGPASVEVAVAGGNAPLADYEIARPVRLEWTDGDAEQKTFTVLYKGSVTGSGRTLVLALRNPSTGVTVGSTSSTILSVRPATVPGTLGFEAAAYMASVPESGDGVVSVTVQRTMGAKGRVTVQIQPFGGTASGTEDFALPENRVLTWEDGDLADKTFEVIIKAGAQIAVAGETIQLRLQSATGGALLGTATTTIRVAGAPAVPVVQIAFPAANAKLTAESVVVKGTASDADGVDRVEVQLNDGEWVEANLTKTGNGTAAEWMLAVVPEQGANTVRVKAHDADGTASAEMTRAFTFNYVRDLLAGTYEGVLVPATDVATLEDAEDAPAIAAFGQTRGRGRLSVLVTATGAFSGKLHTGGMELGVKGVLRRDGTALFAGGLEAVPVVKGSRASRMGLGSLTLRANESGMSPVLLGELRTESGDVTFGEFALRKARYSTAKVLPEGMLRMPASVVDPAQENGRYTALFEPRMEDGANNGVTAYPQASGFARMSVTTAGVATVSGRLADGSAVSYSGRVVDGDVTPVYVPLYGNRGFVSGTLEWDSEALETDVSGRDFWWHRPAGLAAPYGAGWPEGIQVDVAGSKYVPPSKPTAKVPNPANPYSVFGAELPVNASPVVWDDIPDQLVLDVDLALGGLAAGTRNEARLNATNRVTVPADGGVSGLRLAFSAGDGMLSGSFTHPVTGKAMGFGGAVLQKQKRVAGYFLYAPAAGDASAGSVQIGIRE
jgi:formylglycine-generating enzyme required for sulfatase activity